MFKNNPAIVPWTLQDTPGKTLIEFEGGCPDDFTEKDRAAVVNLLEKHGLSDVLVIVDDADGCGYLMLIDEATDGERFECALNMDDESLLEADNSLVPGAFIYELLRLITAAASPDEPGRARHAREAHQRPPQRPHHLVPRGRRRLRSLHVGRRRAAADQLGPTPARKTQQPVLGTCRP